MSDEGSQVVKVAVCIPTAWRTEYLARLLQGLDRLAFEEVPEPKVEVVVVDNDPGGSARTVCESQRGQGRWPVSYHIEPRPGVTHARNTAIREAPSDADFIAMIDDDEVPEPSWLDALLAAREKYGSDIVTGPVLPLFEEMDDSLRWIERGRFFAPPRYQSGKELEKGFTGNILVRAALLREMESPFDNRFALKGAEDSHLFMSLRRDGHRIVWTNEAVAHESIGRARMSMRWILARNFWGWSCQAVLEKEVFGPRSALVLKRLGKGVLLLGWGSAELIPSVFGGKRRVCQALVRASRGLGSIAGVLGIQGAWPR